jgi:hypothetical protein
MGKVSAGRKGAKQSKETGERSNGTCFRNTLRSREFLGFATTGSVGVGFVPSTIDFFGTIHRAFT